MTAPVPSMTQACTIRFAKSKATILDAVMVDLPACSGTLRCRVGHDRVPFVQDREGPSHHPEVRGRPSSPPRPHVWTFPTCQADGVVRHTCIRPETAMMKICHAARA